jgi:hypothetical protein
MKLKREKIPEETMKKRREERLERLIFFMKDTRASGLTFIARAEAHNLLTGFFQNSEWATAWFCVKAATRNSWTGFKWSVRYFYYYKILRLTNEEVGARIDAELGLESEEDEWDDEIMDDEPFIVADSKSFRVTDLKDGTSEIWDKETNEKEIVTNAAILRILEELKDDNKK